MNTAKTFTPGVVVGMTRIPDTTLRRYIRDYRPFFSELASYPHRGRRYTPQDVQTVLLIRRLYQDGYNRDAIIDALQGGWIPPGLPSTDTEAASLIYAQAVELLTAANRQARRAETLASHAESIMNSLPPRIKRAEARIHKLERKESGFNW